MERNEAPGLERPTARRAGSAILAIAADSWCEVRVIEKVPGLFYCIAKGKGAGANVI